MEQLPKSKIANPPADFAADVEVRQDKVDKLKQALQNGTYRISSDDVARKLIEHMLRPKD
jgi:flagellar biosynthesis anti-sigma factor FlgM